MLPCRSDKEIILESLLEEAYQKIGKLKYLVKESYYDALTDGWDEHEPLLSWERSITKKQLDSL